jgi:energy-coupling factor transporter ATP-binding protein EcfA2
VSALGGVDLTVTSGRGHCLIGQNGAGKSTLIKCVSGLDEPTAGEVRLDGAPLPVGIRTRRSPATSPPSIRNSTWSRTCRSHTTCFWATNARRSRLSGEDFGSMPQCARAAEVGALQSWLVVKRSSADGLVTWGSICLVDSESRAIDRLNARPRRCVDRALAFICYSLARPSASSPLRPRLASVRGASRRKSRPSSTEAI